MFDKTKQVLAMSPDSSLQGGRKDWEWRRLILRRQAVRAGQADPGDQTSHQIVSSLFYSFYLQFRLGGVGRGPVNWPGPRAFDRT